MTIVFACQVWQPGDRHDFRNLEESRDAETCSGSNDPERRCSHHEAVSCRDTATAQNRRQEHTRRISIPTRNSSWNFAPIADWVIRPRLAEDHRRRRSLHAGRRPQAVSDPGRSDRAAGIRRHGARRRTGTAGKQHQHQRWLCGHRRNRATDSHSWVDLGPESRVVIEDLQKDSRRQSSETRRAARTGRPRRPKVRSSSVATAASTVALESCSRPSSNRTLTHGS